MSKKEARKRKNFLFDMLIAHAIYEKPTENGQSIDEVREEYLEIMENFRIGAYK